ncbi:MAG: hypothetical protein AAF557_14835 [Pseudomonadota bacterium]
MEEATNSRTAWITRIVVAAIALGLGWVLFSSPDGRKNRLCEDQTSAYYQPDHPDCAKNG